MDRHLLTRGLLVVALATLLAGAASAQNLSMAQQQALRSACAADMRSACAGVQPGGGRLLQCIRANPDKISQGCKDALAAAGLVQAQ